MPSPSEADAKRRVKKLRKKIAGPQDVRDERISPDDRDVLIEFDEQMVADRRDSNRCGWKHHRNVLTHLYEYGVETDALAKSLDSGQRGKDGKDELVRYAEANYDNGYTLQAKLSAIRIFAQTVLDDVMLPPRFSKIEPSEHVEEDPAPLPSEIVEYDEILRMIEECNILRDRALIPCQWENGPRPMEEMHTLQRENLKIKDDVILITLPRTAGKTERRDLPVIAAMPYLRKWLQEHPVWDDPDVPINREDNTIEDIPPETYIWTHHNKNELLEYQSLADRFSKAADDAGVTKQTCPQHMRRSAASIAARQPQMGERDLRNLFDWSRFSTSPQHYIAAHSDKTLINITRARGHEVETFEEDIDTSPIICERCGDWTMRGIDNCVHCSYDLSDEQANIDDMARPVSNPYEADKSISQKILDGDVTASDLESVEKVQSDIEAMGQQFFSKISKWKKHARALEQTNVYAGVAGLGASIATVAGSATEAWGRAKAKAAAIHPTMTAPSQMSTRRKAWFYTSMVGSLVMMLVVLYIDGALQDLASGDPTEWLGLLLAVGFWKWLMDRNFPDIEEARAAAQEQEA